MSPAGDADKEGGIEDGSGGDDRFVEGRRGAVAFGEFLPDGRCGEVEISQSLQVAQSDAQRPVVYFQMSSEQYSRSSDHPKVRS